MIAFQLAVRNIMGAGIRSLLNIVVLSFAFIIIIWYNGVIDGWNQQARKDTIDWEIAQGQYWHPAYDPLDYFSYPDAHGPIPAVFEAAVAERKLEPVLIAQASAFPEGRLQGVLLRGIRPDQSLLQLPTPSLADTAGIFPAIIGSRMAKAMKLAEGDRVLVRWRDGKGVYDALELTITAVFACNVPSVDAGQIWLSLPLLQRMLNMEGQASMLISAEQVYAHPASDWTARDHGFLLRDLDTIIQSKKGGGSIMYAMLMIIALLAIFDTQVLSVFRRQKEIGTYIALGMTRRQVMGIFTFEGSMYAILAILLGALYGAPLLYYQARVGWAMPAGSTDMGLSIAEKIYPVYGFGLIASTVVLVVVSATVVSFLPARKIARLNPTDAIKGKIS
jgi:putative ABC transport system permease protein